MGVKEIERSAPASARLTGAVHVVAAAGAVLLVGSVAFALWSLAIETLTDGVRYGRWDAATPQHIALWALGGAVPVLVALWVPLRGGRWSVALGASLGMGLLVAASAAWFPGGLLRTYTILSTSYAPSQELSAAFTAWVLALAGCVVTLVASFPLLEAAPTSRRYLSLGAVAGIVAVTLAGVLIMRDADPDRRLDATTAPDVGTPELPVTFSDVRQFTLQLNWDDGDDPLDLNTGAFVRGAGPGFVVRESAGLRAFDAAGDERWHFVHTGGWRVVDFRVFDGGSTVVAMFGSDEEGSGYVVALDATTGRQLWSSTDPELLEAHRYYASNSDASDEPLFLTILVGNELSRIDTRTGARMWTVPIPDDYERLDTEAGIGYFTGIVDADQAEVHYVTLDPGTGDVTFDVVASSYALSEIAAPEQFSATHIFSPTHAGRYGVAFGDRIGREIFVDASTGEVTQLPGAVMFGTVSTDGFISVRDGIDTLREGAEARCTLPEDTVVASTAWLRDAVISVGDGAMTVFRRADCSEAAVVDDYGDVVVVPGAVLILSTDRQTITGYA